ncbi:MAG: PIN domain-containing protein [Gammaproteobacteria bacterium]|nr:MAG: PIN domain-containing protein [Gammaproteobacteria bacterium]
MIVVDTNVLVRLLVDDPGSGEQVRTARTRVKHAKQVFVPQVVQAETVWVLESAYGLDKTTIISILEHLARNQAFVLQHEASHQKALSAYRKGSADFADYLIWAQCEAAGHPLLTFDRRLARTAGVIGLGP